MKVNNKQHGIISQKVGGGGVSWLITPHSTLKWEVCRCKYIYIIVYVYVYIFSQTMCTENKRN